MKICTKCGVNKPLSDYSPRSDRPGKYFSHCRECERQSYRDRYAADPEKHRERRRDQWHQGKKYGLTKEELDAMYDAQDSRCAWCGIHEWDTARKKLYVDHCHRTGLVRRLLCQNCNTAEGNLKHAPHIIAAIEAVAWYNVHKNSLAKEME